MTSYEDSDKSKQSLPFDSPYFPAYFRLLKWKILDVCVGSTSGINDIGYFELFTDCFPPGKLEEIVEKIIGEAKPLTEDPLFQQIKESQDIDDKSRRNAETYLKMLHEHTIKVQRRRYSEHFLSKILFNEEGLRIADKLMFDNCPQLYNTAHWEALPQNWMTTETIKKRFYDEEEVEANPYGQQRLDRVAGSARGSIIMQYFKSKNQFSDEFHILNREIDDRENICQTELVKKLLDEGPVYELKMQDGEEVKMLAEKWNVHKTLVIFLYMAGFKAQSSLLQEGWYYGLLEAMRNDPTNRAALYFLNKNYAEELEEREKERKIAALKEIRGLNLDEEGVGDQIFKEIRPQLHESGYDPDAEHIDLVLRSYQEELVQPVLEGHNCVVVAPTGSGKTEVAVYGALNHIRERHLKKQTARVVMLVPKIPLVSQQRTRFLKYCNGKHIVNGFHGSENSDSGEGRRDDVLNSHIVVMTPQILINMLQSVRLQERLYVSDFSMMIFDEVHYTSGNHPYVLINQLVQEWEYDKPQIVGLTASLHVSSGAQEISQMLAGIYKMLALLNTPVLSTMKQPASIDELNQYVDVPDDSVEICMPGENELRDYIERWLVTSNHKFLKELEALTKSRHCCFPSNIYRAFKAANPKRYEEYESTLQNVIYELNKMNTPEKVIAQMWSKYIKIYIEARGIVDLMPARVALKYMADAIRELEKGKGQITSTFGDFLGKHYEYFSKQASDVESTIVTKLKETLVSQFRVQPESRCIIFVTQRNTAQRVCEFLNASGVMNRFREPGSDDEMIGFVLGTNKQGVVQQSRQQQTAVLSKFNSGHLKVIVATSVVEEGLDVAACNLIIKYNCASASAIKLVQQRGRARAKNSRSILLTIKSSINEQQNNAILSEKFMKQCVKKIEEQGAKVLIDEVDRAKKQIENQRKLEAEEALANRLKHANDIYKVNCSQCSKTFCSSRYIKKVYSNYMVFDPECWDMFNVEPIRKVNKYLSEETQALSTLKCASCNMETIGKVYKMRGVYLPQISVGSVNFVPEDGSENQIKKKWSAVETDLFFIGEAQQSDFAQMLNALCTNEGNMIKKRILDMDSKQHIKDIEMKKIRTREEVEEKRAQEQARRDKKEQKEGPSVVEDEE